MTDKINWILIDKINIILIIQNTDKICIESYI